MQQASLSLDLLMSQTVAQIQMKRFLAKVPYLFAIQQGLEGIIWIYLDKGQKIYGT